MENSKEYMEAKPIKIFPPGCQLNYPCVVTSNDIYYAYASTMTINVFTIKNNQLKCILNPKIEKFVKCICLSQTDSNVLVSYYDEELLFFSINDEKVTDRYKTPEPRVIEINKDGKILIVSNKDELYYFDHSKKKLETIKTHGKVITGTWNPFNQNELVYASTDKTIYYHTITQKNKLSSISLDIKDSFITALSWYTSDESCKYVLVGTSDGYSYLVDIANTMIIMSFDKFSNFVTGIVWIRHEPGTFMMFSKGTGRATLWNVSKKSYNSLIKISDSPILRYNYLDDTSLLLSLDNGEIIIYNLKINKIIFKLEAGHSETIFNLNFNSLSNGILATCAYDSCIKIWDINDNKLLHNLRVDLATNTEKVGIYSIRWSPKDKELLASRDNKGEIKIWDISKQKLLTSIKLNNKNESIVGIDWILKGGENTIAATCFDSVFICKYNLGKLNLFKTLKAGSAGISLVMFDPFDYSNLAVGCGDNNIRIFTINEKSDPPKLLTGHTSKVFSVCYHPRNKTILATSSDDTRIGLWNLENNSSRFITGHTNKSRHLVWLTDFDNILISGSWDGTIKFWNIDSLTCIGSIAENYSDIYGIAISPFNPFLLVSVSRDNSVRFWNILPSRSEIVLYG
jgi:WD40 repeat protein